jgi:hypothetical protein
LGKIMDNIKNLHHKIADEASTRLGKVRETIAVGRTASQFSAVQALSNPFFMIGIPGSVHIMKLNARYIPENVNLVLILNGMDEWEEEKARYLLKPKGVIKIKNDRMISHGKVLDMLFDNVLKPFGILDYDCFVFNSSLFQNIKKLEPGVMLNSAFYKDSPIFGKTPHTFFCFFQTGTIRTIREKYKVDCGITDFSKKIPQKAVRQLMKIGIYEKNYPESGKNYFDTLRLIVSLGISEGYSCQYLDLHSTNSTQNPDVFHVGGVANPNSTYGWWSVRGSYFWWRALETCEDNDIVHNYYEKYGKRNSCDIFEGFPDYKQQTKQEYFDIVEKIVSSEY